MWKKFYCRDVVLIENIIEWLLFLGSKKKNIYDYFDLRKFIYYSQTQQFSKRTKILLKSIFSESILDEANNCFS